jgi:hypothetical protein
VTMNGGQQVDRLLGLSHLVDAIGRCELASVPGPTGNDSPLLLTLLGFTVEHGSEWAVTPQHAFKADDPYFFQPFLISQAESQKS